MKKKVGFILLFFLLVSCDNHKSTRLIILLVGDQMRPDHLSRFENLYSGGFKWFIDNNTTGLYHLTNGIPISKYDLLHLFKNHTNKHIKISKVDGIDTNKSFIDTRKEINYLLPTYNQMISDMVTFIKNNRTLYGHYNL